MLYNVVDGVSNDTNVEYPKVLISVITHKRELVALYAHVSNVTAWELFVEKPFNAKKSTLP